MYEKKTNAEMQCSIKGDLFFNKNGFLHHLPEYIGVIIHYSRKNCWCERKSEGEERLKYLGRQVGVGCSSQVQNWPLVGPRMHGHNVWGETEWRDLPN